MGVQGHVETGEASPEGKRGSVQKHLHCRTTAPEKCHFCSAREEEIGSKVPWKSLVGSSPCP